MSEIQSRQEIKQLVDSFYEKVNNDELLSPIFNDIAGIDWEKHLPIMYNFWGTLLLGEMSYQGNPFLKHIPLPIDKNHFERWLQLFHETVDEHFTGEIAEEAKKRASSIAGAFRYRMETLNKPGSA